MAFQPGKSGNLRGRPRGAGKVPKYRALLHAEAEALIGVLIKLALDGDLAAMKLCLDRVLPPLRAVDLPIQIELPGSLADRAECVIQALADGRISPDTAQTIMGALRQHAELTAIRELEQRITALEEKGHELTDED